jgi:drug/metabolite transporter (DMT)-like permease
VTPGFGLALGAMVCLGLADVVYKHGAAAGVKPHQFLMAQAWLFAPATFFYGFVTGTLEFKPYVLWGCGAGVFVFIALINFVRALQGGSVSLIAPIFRLSFTVTTALAVLVLAEPLTAPKLIGLAAAFAAVWLLLGGEAGNAQGQGARRSALVRVLIAMAAMGVANFFYKLGAGAGGVPGAFVSGQAAVFLPLATAYVWLTDRSLKLPAVAWRHGGATAGLFLVGVVLLFASLSRGEASVLVPVSQMGFMVTAAYGVLLLREPFTARKGGGLLLALAALVCLAIS